MTDEQSAARAGVARYCYALIDALMKLDTEHRFVVAHGEWFGPPQKWKEQTNWTFEAANGPLRRTKTFWDSFSSRWFIARHKPDVWLSTAHALPIFSNVPCLLTVHDLFVFQYPQHFSLRHRLVIGGALKRAVRHADRILSVSEYTAGELERRFGIPRERIMVTPLGPGNLVNRVDPESVSMRDLAWTGTPSDRYLLTLSTREPRKNLSRLLRAYAKLVEEPGLQDLGLVIAGGSGWMTSGLLDEARKLGLQRVSFLGYVPDEDLPALFACCEAFVFPSLAEGFGLPVLEAMLLGAPVVCSNTTSIPEVAGDAAVYFDPASVDAMTAAILGVLRTPERRPERIQKGFEQAAQFTWERCAKLTLEAIVQTAESRL